MKRKLLLIGLLSIGMLSFTGCSKIDRNMVEGTIVKKDFSLHDKYALVEYKGYYDRLYTDVAIRDLNIGDKIKLIKTEYKDLSGNTKLVRLDLP